MLFINFDDVAKGQKISGGFTPIRILATIVKLKLKGHKPIIYRAEPHVRIERKGWFVQKGDGGKSGEPLIGESGHLTIGGFILKMRMAREYAQTKIVMRLKNCLSSFNFTWHIKC